MSSGHRARVKQMIRLAFGVEVLHLILAPQSRHPVIAERHPPPGVLERGPDDVLELACFAAWAMFFA